MDLLDKYRLKYPKNQKYKMKYICILKIILLTNSPSIFWKKANLFRAHLFLNQQKHRFMCLNPIYDDSETVDAAKRNAYLHNFSMSIYFNYFSTTLVDT